MGARSDDVRRAGGAGTQISVTVPAYLAVELRQAAARLGKSTSEVTAKAIDFGFDRALEFFDDEQEARA